MVVGKGIYEVKVGKKIVGFKFGTNAAVATEKHLGYGIVQLMNEVLQKKNMVNNLLGYFYGGAVAYASSHDLKPPTVDNVGDMIDDIGYDEALRIFNESSKVPVPKNGLPPKA